MRLIQSPSPFTLKIDFIHPTTSTSTDWEKKNTFQYSAPVSVLFRSQVKSILSLSSRICSHTTTIIGKIYILIHFHHLSHFTLHNDVLGLSWWGVNYFFLSSQNEIVRPWWRNIFFLLSDSMPLQLAGSNVFDSSHWNGIGCRLFCWHGNESNIVNRIVIALINSTLFHCWHFEVLQPILFFFVFFSTHARVVNMILSQVSLKFSSVSNCCCQILLLHMTGHARPTHPSTILKLIIDNKLNSMARKLSIRWASLYLLIRLELITSLPLWLIWV